MCSLKRHPVTLDSRDHNFCFMSNRHDTNVADPLPVVSSIHPFLFTLLTPSALNLLCFLSVPLPLSPRFNGV